MSKRNKTAPVIEAPSQPWQQPGNPPMPDQSWTAYRYIALRSEGDFGQPLRADRLTPLGSVEAPSYADARGIAEQRWGPAIDYVEPKDSANQPVKSPKER